MHQIEIELDVPVPMRDGVILRADIYRPAGEGVYPVVVSRGPYDKNDWANSLMDLKTMVRSGYVVVLQDTRGRFLSEGEWMPWKYERQDGYDTVEWAAALPCSDGNVGMVGPSYLGSTQWSAAIANPPHLRTIVPVVTWSEPEDGLMFRGGAIELGFNVAWSLAMALGQHTKEDLPPEELEAKFVSTLGDFDTLAASTYWKLPSGAHPAIVAAGHPDSGVARALADRATTEEARVAGRYDEIDLPTLSFAGWYDAFLQGTLDNYIGMRSRGRTARLIVGPWWHDSMISPLSGGQVGEVNFGIGAQLPGGQTYTEIHRDWYDHWLKGLPATENHESGVLIFLMGINEWRSEPDWPLMRARETPLYLADGGVLSWAVPDTEDASSGYLYDPADPVPTRGGHLVMTTDYPPGAFDQCVQEARDDVLVFTTEQLASDLEITGRIRATLFASTDGPSTDWVVRLCEVDASGISRNIADGITRVRAEPGAVGEVEVDLWSTSIVVRAGHRLRVHVTSSNFPRWDRNLNTGEPETEGVTMRVARQRVFHDRTHLSRITLPVVPAEDVSDLP